MHISLNSSPFQVIRKWRPSLSEVEMKSGNTRRPVVLTPEKQRITVRKKYINYARSGPNTILSDVGAWKFRSRIPFTHTAKITTNPRKFSHTSKG